MVAIVSWNVMERLGFQCSPAHDGTAGGFKKVEPSW